MALQILKKLNLECNLTDEYLTNIQKLIKDEYNKKYNINKIFNYISTTYDIQQNVQTIARMKQYKQRSPEWFSQREKMISASDMAAVFGIGYNTQKQLMEKKVLNNSTFKGNKFTRWGQKYEDIASIVYEKRNKKTVLEFGLIQHPKYSYIGASPDGITTDGIMLEIKCPSTREINGIPPANYEIQMQIQLEVCELDVCDFCEIKVDEYDTEEDYLEHNNNGLEKGILIKLGNYGNNEPLYIYPKSYMLGDDKLLFEWRDNIIFENNGKYHYIEPCYWFLKQYSCVPVYRNTEWFSEKLCEITTMWDKIIYYREHLDEYHETYKKRKRNTMKVVKLNSTNSTNTTKISSFHNELYNQDITVMLEGTKKQKNCTISNKKSSFHDEIYNQCTVLENNNNINTITNDLENLLSINIDNKNNDENIILI